MSTTIIVLIAYLGVLAAVAFWSARETHTLSGFYLAGKKLPFSPSGYRSQSILVASSLSMISSFCLVDQSTLSLDSCETTGWMSIVF